MPDRVSLIEQYDNRDVIAQIYRIIDIAEHGAIETLTATKEGSMVKLIFTMHDGTKHEITFESNGVKDVYAVQSGSTETVHVVLDDDSEKTFAFNIAIAGVSTDTQQTITASKVFTAPQTFSGGIVGTTMIDGDVQVSNGHSLSVAGDIDTAGDLQVAGNAEFLGNVEAGGMAIEESNGRTILSNSNGIIMDGQLTLDSISVGDVTAGGMSIGMSGDGSTVLNNNNGVRIGQSLKVPTTSTGTRSDDAVNGTRLQNDLDNYAFMVRTTGGNIVGGTNEWTGKQIVRTLGPVRAGAGTPDQVWSVMGKAIVPDNSSCRLVAFVSFTQSNRMVLMHCNFRVSGNGPACDVYLHKSYTVNSIAMNYDPSTGEVLLLMRTPYIYQRPQLIPIIASKDDNVSGTAIDYTDTRTFVSAEEFPLPNTNYATFLGVDN